MKRFLPVMCACAVAACGGGEPGTTAPQPASGPEVAQFLKTHVGTNITEGSALITPANYPSGTAELKGFLLLNKNNTTPSSNLDFVAGRATTKVDFGAATVSGTVKDFGEYTATGINTDQEAVGVPASFQATLQRPVAGSMTLRGTLNPTSTHLKSDLTASGTLSGASSVPLVNGDVNAKLSGSLYYGTSNNNKLVGAYHGGAATEIQNGQTSSVMESSITVDGVERGDTISANMIVVE